MTRKRIYLKVIFCLLILIAYSITVFASANDAGNRILSKALMLGKWSILIKGSYDVVCSYLKGDTKGIGRTVFMAAACYAALLYLPTILKWVEELVR